MSEKYFKKMYKIKCVLKNNFDCAELLCSLQGMVYTIIKKLRYFFSIEKHIQSLKMLQVAIIGDTTQPYEKYQHILLFKYKKIPCILIFVQKF